MARLTVDVGVPRTEVRVAAGIPIPGPAGPPGEPGPPGDSSEALGYVHVQAVAATTWAITHPLPFVPNVMVVDSSGNKVETNVRVVSPTVIHVTVGSPFAGTAYLS